MTILASRQRPTSPWHLSQSGDCCVWFDLVLVLVVLVLVVMVACGRMT